MSINNKDPNLQMDQDERVQIPQDSGSKIYEMSGRSKHIGGHSKSKIGVRQQIGNLVQNYGEKSGLSLSLVHCEDVQLF